MATNEITKEQAMKLAAAMLKSSARVGAPKLVSPKK